MDPDKSLSDDSRLKRFFHDKIGIFTDDLQNKVEFSGSMNETFKGLDAVVNGGNYESIDVNRSWMGEDSLERISSATIYFEKLWNDVYDGISVVEFPEVSKELLVSYSKGVIFDQLLDEIECKTKLNSSWSIPTSPFLPKKHQDSVLNSWKNNNFRGIVKHATGSGKTFTAACACNYAFSNRKTPVIIVPSQELLFQWKRDLTSYYGKRNLRFILCGADKTKWKKMLNHCIYEYIPDTIVIAIVNTAITDKFLSAFNRPESVFLIGDEVHRFGSPEFQKIFTIDSIWRLGMSATPERFGDPDGTKALIDYFGPILKPEYSLSDAISNGDLCGYNYHPMLIHLSEEEQSQWDSFKKRIIIAKSRYEKDPSDENKTKLDLLYIKRSRVIKHVSNKIPACVNVILDNYKPGQHWIIYCDDVSQLDDVFNSLSAHSLHPIKYYSDMEGDRSDALAYFSDVGGILIAIKCFDEGVSIPSVSHAIILASSKNPREFIQRRGRVLRKSPGKNLAEIYDMIVAPSVVDDIDSSNSILISELARSLEFARDAFSCSSVHLLKQIAITYNINLEDAVNWGFEDEQ